MQILQKSDDRIAKVLLQTLLTRNAKGFCEELRSAINLLNVDSLDVLLEKKDIRKYLKEKIMEINQTILKKKMIVGSKSSKIISKEFRFDGEMKLYLQKLSFKEARLIFMIRSGMMPTKTNFEGRWKGDARCIFCSNEDNDEHLFTCPGYVDLIPEEINYDMFFDDNTSIEELSNGAKCLENIISRLELFQGQ